MTLLLSSGECFLMGLWGHSTVPRVSWCQPVNYAPTCRKLVNKVGCIFGHGCLAVDKLLQACSWVFNQIKSKWPRPTSASKKSKMAVVIIPNLRPANHSQQTSGCCHCGSICYGFVHLSMLAEPRRWTEEHSLFSRGISITFWPLESWRKAAKETN